MKSHHLSSKGILLGLVASFLLCAGNASAQDYIGGSFSFNSSSSSGSNSSATGFNVSPDLGWFVGERWAVGIRPRIGFGSSTNSDRQSRSFSVGITPYARYLLLAHNRFGLWGEADSNLSFSRYDDLSNGSWTPSDRVFTYGIDILPVLTYQLNRHISLESRLNVFSFGLRKSDEIRSEDLHLSSFSCGLKATSQDIFGALGDISIGFLYKF